MCMPIDDAAMLCWLISQLRVIEAWQDELASRPDADLLQVERLERHHAWLHEELARLRPLRRAA
ncbi:MAG: hypothetical protein VR75_04740 [Hyphomonadaceae bacterium BRH_c29]|nr:MAG: hypothetical protein VR75_04740 [Hyphomonadaceae bacterium BRH_c29]